MNSNFFKKNWFIIIVILFISTGFVMGFIQSLPFNNIHNFDYEGMTYINIYDRGILGNDAIKITDRGTVQKIIHLLKNSPSYPDPILKNSQGLCEMELIYKNKSGKSLQVTKTVLDGGIITSGQRNFRNDSLLSFVIAELQNHRQKKY